MALQAKTIKPAGTGLDKNSSDIPNIEKSEPAEADTLLKILEEQNRLLEKDTRYKNRISRSESNASTNSVELKPLKPPTQGAQQLSPPQTTPTAPPQSPLQPQVTPSTSSPPQTTPIIEQEMTSTTGDTSAPLIDEEEILSMWASVIKNWEESVKKNSKLIKQLVRKGIPDPLRGMVWQLLSGPLNEGLKKMYPSLITEESCPFEKQIKRDLDRTFPEHSFFKDRDGAGQESLLSVMKAYSLYDREVGYCQGSLFLAGELLMHMPEEETFCVFVQLMNKYKLRELYKPSMAQLSTCFYQLESLVEELFPKLHIHFKALVRFNPLLIAKIGHMHEWGFYTSMYSSSWFLTLFASSLSLNIAFRVMDIFLEEGLECVFRIGLALMELNHDKLMSMDLEEMTKLIQKGVKTIHESDADKLFDTAFKMKISSKKLKKLEKEYLLKKEKQATENSNISLLKEENENLEKRVMALEIECAALADRLIQGQVTRAQEAEEMFTTKNEVFKLRKKLKELLKEDQIQSDSVTTTECSSAQPRQSLLEITERDRSISAPSLRDTLVSSPSSSTLENPNNTEHVSREEAQQCLRELGVSPTTPTSGPVLSMSRSSTPDVESLLQNLATVKIQHAETLHSLELKSLELKEALQREKSIRNQLEKARKLVDILQKEKELLLPSSVCPHCGLSSTLSVQSTRISQEEEQDDLSSSCPSQNDIEDETDTLVETAVAMTTQSLSPTSESNTETSSGNTTSILNDSKNDS